MSKFYIGGVANVSAFVPDKVTGEIRHFFDAKTLTDSSINVSVSNEEIRGGEGAQLLGKFFHTTSFNLSLTDALFDLKYIATQVGSEVEAGVLTSIMKSYKLSTSNQIETDDEVAPLQFGSMYKATLIGWDNDGNTYSLTGSGTSYTVELPSGVLKYPDCITVAIKQHGDQVKVKAAYTPGVMSLIMRARLFVGDSCRPSDGKPVGEVVIEIPKFQLDGTIDLAMAMTSPATYSLSGSALANGCGCDDEMWYAKITEVIENSNKDPFYGYTGIVFDGDYLRVNNTFGVYAFAVGKTPRALLPTQYQVTGTGTVDPSGVITAEGAFTVTANIPGSVINGESASGTFERAE